jgi:hypothetical protein
MKKISTHVYIENFAENGVTTRHFVTAERCDPDSLHRRFEPVSRRYRPESVATDELVNVLYWLLVDVPAGEFASAGSSCFPCHHE